jgi:hypothetical protein
LKCEVSSESRSWYLRSDKQMVLCRKWKKQS